MFDVVWSIVKGCFELFFNFLSTAELKAGVTFWDVILVFFIGGGIIGVILHSLGGNAIASAGSSLARSSLDNHKDRPAKKD